MILLEIGKIKRHKYPLARLCIRFDKDFNLHKSIQWCFVYKMFKIGHFEFYYHSVDQAS